MADSRFGRFAALIGCALLPYWLASISAGAAVAAPSDEVKPDAQAQATDEHTGEYLRVVDEPDQSISLEIASRTFVHEDTSRPTISLISVAHIADQSFYRDITEKLKRYDRVLYEAVAPAGVRSGQGETREEKIQSTRQALRFVAGMIERHRAEQGEYPADMSALQDYITTLDPLVRNWFHHAVTDPWDQPLIYERTEEHPGYVLFSAGPPAGEAVSQEDHHAVEGGRIVFADHDSIHPMPREEDNLQKQLAEALGLAYQLESLPYESSNWVISDMTAEALFHEFSGTDVDYDLFSGSITGTSLPARLIGMLLRVIQVLDTMYDGAVSDMVKVLFIEILGDEQMVQASMAQMGADFATILIDKRNQVVIDDVAALLEDEPELESIAILYGAAHMPDLAERLKDQLGYTAHDEAAWLRAMTVDLTESRIDQRQLMQMRSMIRRMMRSPALRNR